MNPLEVALEVLPDLRIDLDDGTEDGLVELEGLDLAARAHGCRPVTVFEEGDLAEGVTRAERPERALFTSLAAPEHPGRAGDDDVEAVGLRSFLDDHVAEAVRDRLEGLDDEPPCVLGQELEHRKAVEDGGGTVGQLLRDAHATALGFSPHAREPASEPLRAVDLVSADLRAR